MIDPLVRYLQSFRPIDVPDSELILNAFQRKCLKEGDYLLERDHICRELYFIRKGVAKIIRYNDKGGPVIYFFSKENQFCTILHSFNTETPAEEEIRAACDLELSAISKARLQSLYKLLPYLKDVIDQATQQRLLDKVRIRNAYLGLDASDRYRLFLSIEPDVATRVSMTDMAAYLGVTPQSLSRIRRKG
ncbi:MAG TPA: Crp/Fnr family transcriptional regulator [Puia sp.]|jgi:CRP-like cAMP-binding protein|nr:Crp/Fnr family transcriptional regulator [Puia sp.]